MVLRRPAGRRCRRWSAPRRRGCGSGRPPARLARRRRRPRRRRRREGARARSRRCVIGCRPCSSARAARARSASATRSSRSARAVASPVEASASPRMRWSSPAASGAASARSSDGGITATVRSIRRARAPAMDVRWACRWWSFSSPRRMLRLRVFCASRGRHPAATLSPYGGVVMRVISYNLRKHRAAGELANLVERYGADVLCLQEADTTDIPEHIGGLRLAHSTQRNRLGLAVYYRENTYRAVEVRAMGLKKSLHDRVLKPAEERMLGVRLHDIDENREMIVASFHAAPLTALNSLRRHQIRTALERAAAARRGTAGAHGGRLQLPGVQGEPRPEGARAGLRAEPQRLAHVHAVPVLPRALRLRDVDRLHDRPGQDPSAGPVRSPADPRDGEGDGGCRDRARSGSSRAPGGAAALRGLSSVPSAPRKLRL